MVKVTSSLTKEIYKVKLNRKGCRLNKIFSKSKNLNYQDFLYNSEIIRWNCLI